MPILDGYRATQIIRTQEPFNATEAYQAIPILAMTASAIHGDKEKCQEAGMDDYLAKPVRPAKLEHMLVKWAIKGRHKRQQLRKRAISAARTDAAAQKARSGSPAPSAATEPPTAATAATAPPPRAPPQGALETQLGRIVYQSDAALARSSETDNDSEMRHMHQEEMAASLRDDKLLALGSDGRRHQPSLSGALHAQRDHGYPTLPLTAENIVRLGRLRERGEEGDGEGDDDDDEQRQSEVTDSSLAVADEDGEHWRSLKAPPRPSIGDMRQNESERTIGASHYFDDSER